MKAKTAKEVLIAARWIIEHIGWCQGVFARNPRGYALWGGARGEFYEGNSFCSVGALRVVETNYSLRHEAESYLLESLTTPNIGSIDSIAAFNDNPMRTREEVLALFDRAIARAP